MKFHDGKQWSPDCQVSPASEDTRGPQVAVDALGHGWVLSGGRLAGLDAKGLRYELEACPRWDKPDRRRYVQTSGPDHFAIDPAGRFTLFPRSSSRVLPPGFPGLPDGGRTRSRRDQRGATEYAYVTPWRSSSAWATSGTCPCATLIRTIAVIIIRNPAAAQSECYARRSRP